MFDSRGATYSTWFRICAQSLALLRLLFDLSSFLSGYALVHIIMQNKILWQFHSEPQSHVFPILLIVILIMQQRARWYGISNIWRVMTVIRPMNVYYDPQSFTTIYRLLQHFVKIEFYIMCLLKRSQVCLESIYFCVNPVLLYCR